MGGYAGASSVMMSLLPVLAFAAVDGQEQQQQHF
jgi:hypothetical protein